MSKVDRFAVFVVPALLIASALLHIYLPAESDKGWLLHVARMVLEGQKLDVGIVEINPPLIVWLYALPVWVSMHSKFADYEALALIGLLACSFSVVLCTQLIRRHPGFAADDNQRSQFTALLALIFIFYNTQSYFFDREHIFLVLTFPYMLRFMPSLIHEKYSRRLEWAVGLCAAVGYCIKPHTIIVFAALIIFTVLRERSLKALLRTENFIIAGGSLIYFACVWHFTPQFITEIMPIAMATYSDFANRNSSYVYLPAAFISLGLIFADFRPWYVTPYRRDVYYLIGLCFAFLVYALANNGWGYTYNPFFCVILFIGAWMLWEYLWLIGEHSLRELSTRRFDFGLRGCVIVLGLHAAYMLTYLVVLGVNLPSIRSPCDGNPDCWRNGPYAQYINAHDVRSFGTISYDFSNWVMLLRVTPATWDTRFNHLWMLPRLLREGRPFIDAHKSIVEYVAKGLAWDMDTRKPEVMLVDASPGFQGHVRHFDLISLFSELPEFKEAWSHYRYTLTLGVCIKEANTFSSECTFDLYRRVP